MFTYVYAGSEGSSHDVRVLSRAYDANFKVLYGYYYLGDAGYGLNKKILVPYRKVRYHLKEWQTVNLRY